jgi:hypothetical protein
VRAVEAAATRTSFPVDERETSATFEIKVEEELDMAGSRVLKAT